MNINARDRLLLDKMALVDKELPAVEYIMTLARMVVDESNEYNAKNN